MRYPFTLLKNVVRSDRVGGLINLKTLVIESEDPSGNRRTVPEKELKTWWEAEAEAPRALNIHLHLGEVGFSPDRGPFETTDAVLPAAAAASTGSTVELVRSYGNAIVKSVTLGAVCELRLCHPPGTFSVELGGAARQLWVFGGILVDPVHEDAEPRAAAGDHEDALGLGHVRGLDDVVAAPGEHGADLRVRRGHVQRRREGDAGNAWSCIFEEDSTICDSRWSEVFSKNTFKIGITVFVHYRIPWMTHPADDASRALLIRRMTNSFAYYMVGFSGELAQGRRTASLRKR